MDLTRKYLTLTCDVCGNTYLQQARLFKKAKWKNRCEKHRGIKFNSYENGMSYEKSKKCPDCGKIITRWGEKCKSCSHKKHTKKYCIDCGCEILWVSKRCVRCHNKALDKGLSKERNKFNNSKAWSTIRKRRFELDDYTCQICGIRGGYLNVHHIKSYKDHPKLKLEISNLITLCNRCHLQLHHDETFKLKYLRYVS